MSTQSELILRNRKFSSDFNHGEMPVLPALRTVLLTCADARVDPAHVLGLGLGEAVVIRNNGGRVTRAVIEEIATLAVMVTAITEGRETGFELILMQHTQCGAQRLADPELRSMLKNKIGIDVSDYAISNHADDLMTDIGRLASAPELPDTIEVSAMLYDVSDGTAREVAPSRKLGDWRTNKEDEKVTTPL